MAPLTTPVTFCDAHVFHARLRPNGLRFRYELISLLLDLDRFDEIHRISPLFSVGSFNLLSFNARDHGHEDTRALRAHVDRIHADAGLARPARVFLSCFPRLAGFVFDPLSVYVCYDKQDRAASVIYDVRNTFGERHSYLMPLRLDEDNVPMPHECDKIFYVSPFMDMALRYRFLLSPPSQHGFAIKIIERDDAGVVLTALMNATPFSGKPLALISRVALTPLMGFKVMAAIHWQALRLWLRGNRLRKRPPPPPPVSLMFPGEYSAGVRAAGGHADE